MARAKKIGIVLFHQELVSFIELKQCLVFFHEQRLLNCTFLNFYVTLRAKRSVFPFDLPFPKKMLVPVFVKMMVKIGTILFYSNVSIGIFYDCDGIQVLLMMSTTIDVQFCR
jgi:hypothetical protein